MASHNQLFDDPHWGPLFEALEVLAAPLFAAGWKLVATETDESSEYGDSAFYDLERGADRIELEYYEHGQLVAYPNGETTDVDDQMPEPHFVLSDVGRADLVAEFRARRWV